MQRHSNSSQTGAKRKSISIPLDWSNSNLIHEFDRWKAMDLERKQRNLKREKKLNSTYLFLIWIGFGCLEFVAKNPQPLKSLSILELNPQSLQSCNHRTKLMRKMKILLAVVYDEEWANWRRKEVNYNL